MMQALDWLDAVGRHDPVVSRISLEEAWERRPVRVVHAFMVNSRGELWISRRTASERLLPDGLEMGVGGHMERGEKSFSAYERETRGEVTPTALVRRGYA
jgi:isopentenyldiphosphate isomerase